MGVAASVALSAALGLADARWHRWGVSDLTFVMSDPTDEDAPVMRAYADRLVAALAKYLDAKVARKLAESWKVLTSQNELVMKLREARQNRASLEQFRETIADLIEDNELPQRIMTNALREADARDVAEDADGKEAPR